MVNWFWNTQLSKAQFADIQTHLEAWVLREYPELEQRAVFHKNQTAKERAEREAKRQHLSDKGEQMKRRGAKTDKRDQVQERLADIFETATDPRHFADLMEKAGFALYTRGKTHGITDREGNKYRLERLGLAVAWQKLDEKMNSYIHAEKTARQEKSRQEAKPTPEPKTTPPRDEEPRDTTKTENTPTDAEKREKPPSALEVVGYEFLTGKLHEAWHGDQGQHTKAKETKTDHTPSTAQQDPMQSEADKRLADIKAMRAKRAAKQQEQASRKNQDRER